MYLIKESLKSIISSKFSFFFSVLTNTIAVIIILASILVFTLSENIDKYLKDRIEVFLFLSDNAEKNDFENIEIVLKNEKSIKEFNFLSKEAAKQSFIEETKFDFSEILENNPLPDSYTIKLKNEFITPESLESFSNKMKNIAGINDVLYDSGIVFSILMIFDNIKLVLTVLFVFFIFFSIYFIVNTNKLILIGKFEEIETMKLVGADLRFIKFPLFFTSVSIGFVSGTITAIFVLFITKFLSISINLNVDRNDYMYLILGIFLISLVLSLIGYKISSSKISYVINKF